jgi:catechol 2,3-dioxygenase-like lactoylglutathione lyase family enzyme
MSDHVTPLQAQSLQASLTVADLRRSLAWYREVLGFTVTREFEREGRMFAVSVTRAISFQRRDGAKPAPRMWRPDSSTGAVRASRCGRGGTRPGRSRTGR